MSSLQVPAARPAPCRYGEYDPHLGLPPGDAGRTASARVFRGAKGAPGVGHPSRCVSAADCLRSLLQPRKIEEIKDFLLTARRKDAKCKWAPWTGGGDRGLRDAPRNGGRAPGGRFCPRLLSGFGGFSLSPIRQGAWSGVCSLPSLRRVPRGFFASWCVLGTVNGCEELTRWKRPRFWERLKAKAGDGRG